MKSTKVPGVVVDQVQPVDPTLDDMPALEFVGDLLCRADDVREGGLSDQVAEAQRLVRGGVDHRLKKALPVVHLEIADRLVRIEGTQVDGIRVADPREVSLVRPP